MQHIEGEDCDTVPRYWLRREVLLCHTLTEESRYIPIYLDGYSSTDRLSLLQ
jgi:hypothetical protein